MDSTILGSGDNTNAQKTTSKISEELISVGNMEDKQELATDAREEIVNSVLTTQSISENEVKLKNRIAQCRNIIESLKMELNEEKKKLVKDTISSQRPTEPIANSSPVFPCDLSSDTLLGDAGTMYAECVENKLECDESLMKYEKQLQKYQNTLNMAQMEKKNAIRKQMLSKAYRLKLMEVENQCNIELLRVKQSLQCLEPLQMIAKKWKVNTDDAYDANNFELIPRYPELRASSTSELNSFDEFDLKFAVEKTAIDDE